jgi:hypothetical protein
MIKLRTGFNRMWFGIVWFVPVFVPIFCFTTKKDKHSFPFCRFSGGGSIIIMSKHFLYLSIVFCIISCGKDEPDVVPVSRTIIVAMAASMCSNRFMSLYEPAKLYDATDRKAGAIELAETILAKEVKIPSATIAAVKNEMRQLLERENHASAPQGGTGDEPENNEIRQDETPEVQPHGAVLPPCSLVIDRVQYYNYVNGGCKPIVHPAGRYLFRSG